MPDLRTKPTTDARREVIVRVLEQDAGRYWKVAEVVEMLEALHAAGQWPQATWGKARQEPYYCGTAQHLAAMVSLGMVERSPHSRHLFKLKRKLRKHAKEALELQETEGLLGTEVATRLGISNTLAYALLSDPYGDKERERKRGYCGSCGGKKDPAAVTCERCVETKAAKDAAEREAMLPEGDLRSRVLDSIMGLRLAGQDAVVGVTDDFKRIVRWQTSRGEIEHRLARDETWEQAMVAIGIWPDEAAA